MFHVIVKICHKTQYKSIGLERKHSLLSSSGMTISISSWKKEKLLVTSNISFSLSVFCCFEDLPAIYNEFKIVLCKLSLSKDLKFDVWERVNQMTKKIRLYEIESILQTKKRCSPNDDSYFW